MGDALTRPLVAAAQLPWARQSSDQLRFTASLAVVAIIFLPLALWIPSLSLPEPDRKTVEEVPPALARLVQPVPEAPEVTVPEPVVTPEAPPEPAPKPKPRPEPSVEQPPAPTPAVAPPKPEQVPAPRTQTVEQARRTASRSGLLAMKDRLAAMRAPDAAPPPVLTANTRDAAAPTASTQATGSVLAGSGGATITDQPATRELAVAEHRVKTVDAPREAAVKTVAKSSAKSRNPAEGERSMSNIRQVFDAQKAALYALYQRALRKDPTLQGKVLLELVIQPDGSVSDCRVVSSELNDPDLEKRLALRVRLFDFGASKVSTRTVRFPVDFLPG